MAQISFDFLTLRNGVLKIMSSNFLNDRFLFLNMRGLFLESMISRRRPEASHETAHGILVFIAYAHILPLINAHVDVFSKARGLNVGLSLHLHPCLVYASSKGSGESGCLLLR